MGCGQSSPKPGLQKKLGVIFLFPEGFLEHRIHAINRKFLDKPEALEKKRSFNMRNTSKAVFFGIVWEPWLLTQTLPELCENITGGQNLQIILRSRENPSR